mgnify:CR=1 FL=1|tara:strand:+ start:403 stop:711 length:309 start_codon:yes stop_codon:yes gene_type:complete
MKVEILDMNGGWVDGRDRGVEGRVEIDGVEFNFDLTTEDGMTSIYINKEENLQYDNKSYVDASLEDDEDLFMLYDISDEDLVIYDTILDAVCDAGYEIDLDE